MILADETKPDIFIMSGCEQDPDNEELDPRVQDELEKLNNCTDEINRYVVVYCNKNSI